MELLGQRVFVSVILMESGKFPSAKIVPFSIPLAMDGKFEDTDLRLLDGGRSH